jgi:uncharacterized protein DUF3987
MANRVYSAVERASGQTLPNESAETAAEDKIPDFPVECLPPMLEREARGIGELCGVPLAMSGPMVLAVASASIGKGLRVRSLPGRITPANLFILVSKTSGSGGSVTFKHATKPIFGMQKTLRKEFEEQKKPRAEAKRAVLTSQIESLKSKAKRAVESEEREQIEAELAVLNAQLVKAEKECIGKILCVDDVTPEKLAAMLSDQDETMAQINSDAADALGSILGTRYNDGKHTPESIWLKGYTMEPHLQFRQNGNNVQLEAPCIAMLLLVTPDKIQELFRNSRLTNGGLLPRFLSCDSGAKPVPLDTNAVDAQHKLPSDIYEPYKAAIFAAIQGYRICAADKPYETNMTQRAFHLVVEDWNRFCSAVDGTRDYPFEARHTENAIRISLVLHTFRHVDINSHPAVHHGHEHPVDGETFRDAVRIRDWFNLHQENLRKSQRAFADDDAWGTAQAIMRNRSPQFGITSRDLYTGRRVCGTAAEAQRLLAQWKTEGRIESFERKPAEGAGRPTTAYRLAPLSRR